MNRITHFEIQGENLETLRAFYQTLFGWEFTKWENPMTEYWMIRTAPEGSTELGINGGMLKRWGPKPQDGQSVNAFVCTVEVKDLDASVKLVLEQGGSVAMPKFALPGMAWLGYCKDPDGNIFGLYQADSSAK